MSAADTRLLVLGVVRLFGPVNGYQVRRELLSWEVDRWANVNPGSIYSMLTTLTSHGALERHDLAKEEGGRPVAVYTVTPAGEEEFQRSVRTAVAAPPPSGGLLPFRVALSFAPALRRSVFLAGLRTRRIALMEGLAAFDERLALGEAARIPPHVYFGLELERELGRTQLTWVERAIAAVESGGLWFEGEEPSGGMPPDDDPRWRMAEEREQYLQRIHRSDS